MTALVIPGVVTAIPDRAAVAVQGVAAADGISLIKPKPIYAICGAVLAALAVLALT